MSTCKLNAGKHLLQVQINGLIVDRKYFALRI